MTKAVNFVTGKHIGRACFKMRHGGTWEGIFQLASPYFDISPRGCSDVDYWLDF